MSKMFNSINATLNISNDGIKLNIYNSSFWYLQNIRFLYTNFKFENEYTQSNNKTYLQSK